MTPIDRMHPALLRRLKVMAGFGLVRSLPAESGRFCFSVEDRAYEVAVTVNARPDGDEVATVTIVPEKDAAK